MSTQSDDDLALLAEYESEIAIGCTAINLSTDELCDKPALYQVDLRHTHHKHAVKYAFLCAGCYGALVGLPFPLLCNVCKRAGKNHVYHGPDDIVGNPRKL